MRLPLPRGALSVAAGAVFGLLVLAAPGKAQAGCVLGHGGAPNASSGYFEQLLDTGALPPAGQSSVPVNRVPGPCPGGFCSNGPAVPVPPSPLPLRPLDQVACLLAAAQLRVISSPSRPIDSPASYSEPTPGSIDRPPRP